MSSGQANAEILSERRTSLTGLHEQPIVLGFDLAQITSKANYSNPKFGDPQPPLNTLGQGHVAVENEPIVWEMQHASEVYREAGSTAPTLQGRMGTGGNQIPLVGVRRLTPTECERLQGFPDGWTDGQADSHRYKQMGNAVTVNVAEWIGKRIAGRPTYYDQPMRQTGIWLPLPEPPEVK